ncbi:MAG TPA: hypothetical protein VMU61_05010 [Candidatus Aquilonibacter sp.]|nr:hypothetical protein [Candidatus Aquilonibacter sp.]
MFRCIYSLTDQPHSDGEHILQNFLGARWTSHEIVSNDLQRAFGSGIDVDFEECVEVIRNLMGTRGGRGGDGPTLKGLATADQRKVNLLPGGKVQMAGPLLTEIELPDGQKKVLIKAETPEHVAWALAQIKAKYPKTQIDEQALLASATVTEGYIDSPVLHKLELGGPELFRGLLKACFNLLGAVHPEIALQPCFNGVRDYIREGTGGAASYIRWYASEELPKLPRLGSADQHIFIVCRGSSVEGVAQLFGGLVYPFQLTDSYYGPAFTCGYVVDPFRESEPAERRNPEFDVVAVPVFSEQQDEQNEAVIESFKRRLGKIIELHFQRHRKTVIERSLQEVVAAHGGDVITQDIVNDFAELLAHRVLRIERDLGPYKKR